MMSGPWIWCFYGTCLLLSGLSSEANREWRGVRRPQMNWLCSADSLVPCNCRFLLAGSSRSRSNCNFLKAVKAMVMSMVMHISYRKCFVQETILQLLFFIASLWRECTLYSVSSKVHKRRLRLHQIGFAACKTNEHLECNSAH
jgi:hypothetical protein